MRRQFFFSTICLCMSVASSAVADCNARFEEAGVISLSPYNPFSPSDLYSRRSVHVRNLSHKTCSFRIYFKRVPAVGQFSDSLSYALTDDRNATLFTKVITDESQLYLQAAKIPPFVKAAVKFNVNVKRGQISSPGVYTDQFKMVLVSDDDGNEILDQKTLSITMIVEAVSSINLAGGGISTAVEFGKLENGKSRSLILEARSNANYNISITSQNDGHLLLEPPVPGQDWSVSYQMTFDGIATKLDEAAVLGGDKPTSGERTHKLSFKITDARAKRAGIYKDVVTATILPRL